jgi:oligopeptidase A
LPSAELAELQAFAAQELGIAELQSWDRAYAAEKLKQARFAFSTQEVKQYFTEARVLDGLFRLVETLFGVAIRADTAPVWHDSVRFYRVWRGGQAVAAFYLDLHARIGKHGGAWMDNTRTRWRRPDGALQLPVAHLVCNFAPPVGGESRTADTRRRDHPLPRVWPRPAPHAHAGRRPGGVRHCRRGRRRGGTAQPVHGELLLGMGGAAAHDRAHVHTGEPLPRALFDRMVAARHFQSGLQLLRQCEFALFDMRLHGEPDSSTRVQAVADEVCAEVQPMLVPAYYRYPNTFTHLFAGGYAAGYYGYAWAEVLSADAYAAFEEAGVFDPATGQRFRQHILEVGGSRPAMDSFKAFRGREPQLDALLRHQGLA